MGAEVELGKEGAGHHKLLGVEALGRKDSESMYSVLEERAKLVPSFLLLRTDTPGELGVSFSRSWGCASHTCRLSMRSLLREKSISLESSALVAIASFILSTLSPRALC